MQHIDVPSCFPFVSVLLWLFVLLLSFPRTYVIFVHVFFQVVALFNDIITRPLLTGALEAFVRHGVKEEDVEVSE